MYSLTEFCQVSKTNAVTAAVFSLLFALTIGVKLIGWSLVGGVTPLVVLPLAIQLFCVYATSEAIKVLIMDHLLKRQR